VIKILVDLRALAPRGTALSASSAAAAAPTTLASAALVAPTSRTADISRALSSGMIASAAPSARLAAMGLGRLGGRWGGTPGPGRSGTARGRDLFAQLRKDSLKHVD